MVHVIITGEEPLSQPEVCPLVVHQQQSEALEISVPSLKRQYHTGHNAQATSALAQTRARARAQSGARGDQGIVMLQIICLSTRDTA